MLKRYGPKLVGRSQKSEDSRWPNSLIFTRLITVPLWGGMTLTANGQAKITASPCSLEQFLIRQGLPPRSVVIEHNGEAVAPSEFPDRFITEGDRLEIVRIVAGG